MFGFEKKHNVHTAGRYEVGKQSIDKQPTDIQSTDSQTEMTVFGENGSLREVFGEAYRPEGNQPHFMETRGYFRQVRDSGHRIHLLSEQMGESLNMCLRTVHRIHGRALPRMQRILLEAGKISLDFVSRDESAIGG